MKMPDVAKVHPTIDFPVETTHNGQESGQESGQECREERQQIPLEMTYAEKKALLEFRCRVEDAILSNYIFGREKGTCPLRETGKTKEYLRNLTLWGVPLLPSKAHEATDVILLKFLRAKDFKVSEAFNMLQRTLKWRKEMKVDKILEENFDPGLEKLAYIGGKARKGYSLCYSAYGIYKNKEIYMERFGTKEKWEEFLRWNIKFMEKCIQTLHFKPGGANSIIWVVDLKDTPALALKNLPFFNKKIWTMFQDYYPGIIFRKIIINVPRWHLTFHALQVQSLIQMTKSKFIFVRPHRVTETLLKFIAPEDLPVQYGGLKREYDELFSCDKKVLQHKLRCDTTEIIHIPVGQAGMTVFWDMTVVGYDVSYKEEFIPEDDCSYRVLIQKEKKLGKSIRNSFHIREPGKIVLSIENATFKRKVAFYRYSIQPTVTNFTLLRKD